MRPLCYFDDFFGLKRRRYDTGDFFTKNARLSLTSFLHLFSKKSPWERGGGGENGYRQKNNIIRIVNTQTILFKGLPSTVWQMSGKTQLYIFFSGAFHTTQWVDWIPLSLTSPTYFEGFWIFTLYIWIFYIFLKYGIGWCTKLPPPTFVS